MDYHINFKNEEKNEFKKFESDINIDNIDLSNGMIIPNYILLNKDIRLRQFMKEQQDKSEYPLLFVYVKRESESDLKKIKLYDNQIDLDFFKYKMVYLQETYEKKDQSDATQENVVMIPELSKYNVIIIRPDFIIEYLA